MTNTVIDETDTKIVNLLKKNGRLPNTEIAKTLSLSEATVRNRLRRLIDEEFIQVVAIPNHTKLGYGINGNIHITADVKKLDHVIEKLMEIDELEYLAHTTGSSDLEADFFVESIEAVHSLLKERLYKIDGIEDVQLSIVLKYIKDIYNWSVMRDTY